MDRSHGLLLDERAGVSYPDGQQAADSTVFITYDYDRKGDQMALMTSLSEDDILSNDHDVSLVKVFGRRSVISDGGEKKKQNP